MRGYGNMVSYFFAKNTRPIMKGVIVMSDMNTYTIEIHKKDDTTLNNRRIEIFDYLLGLGADPNMILELNAIDIELTIRDFKKNMGYSSKENFLFYFL